MGGGVLRMKSRLTKRFLGADPESFGEINVILNQFEC